jgi:hypothetical protein
MIKLSEQQRKYLAEGLATLALKKPGEAQRSSGYPAPEVTEAPSGTLSPLNALPGGIHVKVTYESMSPADVIGLYFGGDDTFVPQYGSDSRIVIFNVDSPHIAKALGNDVQVGYVVARADGGITSELLTLNVLPLMEGDLNMVKIPQATESTPGKLDLSTFAGDADVVINPWPFIAEGQPVWLDMISESSTQHLLNAYPVTAVEATTGIIRPISRPLLEMIPDASLLEFAAKVQLDGSGSSAGAQPLLPLKLTLQYSGGGGGTGDVIEDFETYASGDKPSPFETPEITFEGADLAIVVLNGSRYFRAHIGPAGTDLNLTLKRQFKRASVEVALSGYVSTRFRCIYQDGQVDEHTLLMESWTTLDFIHDGISSFQVATASPSAEVLIRINQLKLYV